MELIFKILRPVLGFFVLLFERLFPGGKQVHRTAEQKAALAPQLALLQLYQFEACPFCVKVRRELRRLDLGIELRNANPGTGHGRELETQGGMMQVPCLKITDPTSGRVEWLYESDEIIAWLRSRFA